MIPRVKHLQENMMATKATDQFSIQRSEVKEILKGSRRIQNSLLGGESTDQTTMGFAATQTHRVWTLSRGQDKQLKGLPQILMLFTQEMGGKHLHQASNNFLNKL